MFIHFGIAFIFGTISSNNFILPNALNFISERNLLLFGISQHISNVKLFFNKLFGIKIVLKQNLFFSYTFSYTTQRFWFYTQITC